jgi:5-methylcytosine-specific restriction endonuclease McrBC GTP-binding regulatory subunit McrB
LESVDINQKTDQFDQQNLNNIENLRKKMGYKNFVNDKKNNFNMWKGGYLPPNNRLQFGNLELQKERLDTSNDPGLLKYRAN